MTNRENKQIMRNENLKQRTKRFALNVMSLADSAPADRTSEVLSKQLLRAGTSVGANYRAACRAKSPADFISKMGTVEEESDETGYWIELLVESGRLPVASAAALLQEADELTAIAVSSINTARASGSRHSSLRHAATLPPLQESASVVATPHSVASALPPSALRSAESDTPHSELSAIPRSALRTPHSETPHSSEPLAVPHSALRTPHLEDSALRTPHSALE